MPLPNPNPGEAKSDFVGRCMGKLNSEFPDSSQRRAVCETQWTKKTVSLAGAIATALTGKKSLNTKKEKEK